MTTAREITLADTVAWSDDQVSCDLDGEAVLLSVSAGKYFRMDEIGSRIWFALEQPTKLEGLIEDLVAEFEVDREACERDVLAFLHDLAGQRLVRIVE